MSNDVGNVHLWVLCREGHDSELGLTVVVCPVDGISSKAAVPTVGPNLW